MAAHIICNSSSRCFKDLLTSKELGTRVVHVPTWIQAHSHKIRINNSISQSTILIVYFRQTFHITSGLFPKHDFFDTTSGLYTNSPAFHEQVLVLLTVGKVQALTSTPVCSLALCPSTGGFQSLGHRLLTHSLSMALLSSPPRTCRVLCRAQAQPHLCTVMGPMGAFHGETATDKSWRKG